jgi:hypothetical protein
VRHRTAHARRSVSLRSKLRVLVVCVALQVGAASGIPMLPDDICELMNQLNQPSISSIRIANE